MYPSDGTSPQIPYAYVRSSQEFEQGIISWEAKLSNHTGRAQFVLSAEPGAKSATESFTADVGDSSLFAGLNVFDAPYGFAMMRNGAMTPLGGAGHGTKLPTGKWIHLKLVIRGSSIELYAEGVKAVAASCILKRGQISVFLQGKNECSIRNVEVIAATPTCFAVMQFTAEFDVLYRDVIRPICEHYGYKVVRGDDFFTSGQIMEDVLQSIRSSSLIIADVTPDNANVFYELGYAHAIGKPTILLSDRKRDRLPFDISGFRTLFYDNTIGGKAVVEARLRQHLDALHPK